LQEKNPVRKIILASQSKARQKILKQIGLKFSVAVSSVKEDAAIRGKCSDLVIANAARKAKAVAGRFSSGVVIAADTVVLSGRKLIGKPKNKTDALKILTLLSQKPHWVYSGLAVIDIDRGKMFTAHDKTKIYMYRLTDVQIKNYLKKVPVLDKAGGFDIQGPGGVFIDRIEGCFYNVVGLPLAKLAKILHRLDVDIF
jgi:septum formation protein